jgi:hypothetical protein
VAALATASLVAGCGGTGRGSGGSGASAGGSGGRRGDFQVALASSFPRHQRLAQRTSFQVRITNVGGRVMPDVAVTVLNPRYGTAAQAFGTLLAPTRPGRPILASRSRPVWIINRAPGPCGYSCRSRGPGGAATAYSNTWALGRLAPGHTVVFRWKLTAIKAGAYTVEYEVAPGLSGAARAVLANRSPARGRLSVHISSLPPSVKVLGDGRVIQRA